MQIAKILLPFNKLFPLDYQAHNDLELKVGDLVVVPFRNSECTGIVLSLNNSSEVTKLKQVINKAPFGLAINKAMLEFITKSSAYYLSELGSIAKLALPVDISENPIKIKQQTIPKSFNLPELSTQQNNLLLELKSATKPAVIKGITGSGKTEIYFHLIADYLNQGRQVLLMLPEIALGSQIINRFEQRFGFTPAVWNSSITKAQKKQILRGIITGEVKMIIGARSALFLPYHDLALIVIDEEHDSSYKQEEGIPYHARDMAILRASITKSKVVLCSATPSLETINNASIGKYQLFELNIRHAGALMPEIKVIDMKQQKLPYQTWLSEPLKSAIYENLAKKEQVLLFLNRRGYSPLMLCKNCGYRYTCKYCSAWLVLHTSPTRLECHHCGDKRSLPHNCPSCEMEDTHIACGPGIERIAEEVKQYFKEARIEIISKDQLTKIENITNILSKISNNEIDILIGTQVITKGYHFPNLTLVGIVDADLGLNGGDLRAAERTYQLLHQVGGRAGREDKKGVVLMQTYYPDNIILNTLKAGKEDEFLKYEMESRQSAEMPPFTKMASITLTDRNDLKVYGIAKQLVANAPNSNLRILGPAKATMSKLAGRYRYRILLISEKKFPLQKYLSAMLANVKVPSSCTVKIDIDPQNFL